MLHLAALTLWIWSVSAIGFASWSIFSGSSRTSYSAKYIHFIARTYFKVLEYLQKWLFFLDHSFAIELKAIYFSNKNNDFKGNAVLFCFFFFFVRTFLKSNSITFCFSVTWRHTNYQTIKFFPHSLQNSKRNKK